MNKFLRSLLICVASLSGLVFAASHTVVKGDTLYSISRKYGVSVDELCLANGIRQSDALKVGQRLSIPDATVAYTVEKGDTFYSIARRNGISVDELLAMNGLSPSGTLKAGQRLLVPAEAVSGAGPDDDSGNSGRADSGMSDPRFYSGEKGDPSLLWPVKNPEVVYVSGKVSGVQLSAEKNEKVSAVRSGTVMFSGLYRGFGKVVFVQSQTGHMYVYTGLSEISVSKSDYVASGDVLGTVGIDAISGKPRLTFMVFQNGTPMDPAKAPRG